MLRPAPFFDHTLAAIIALVYLASLSIARHYIRHYIQ